MKFIFKSGGRDLSQLTALPFKIRLRVFVTPHDEAIGAEGERVNDGFF